MMLPIIIFVCIILSGLDAFQPQANTRQLSLRNERFHEQRPVTLYNFLDDYKDNLDDEGGISSSGDFPPAICPEEIHRIRFSTTAGDFTIRLNRALSPSGVTRFLQLVDDEFFNDQLLYRVDPGFAIQFGIAPLPEIQSRWDPRVGAPIAPLPDEPNRQHFKAGSVSFAGSGIDSRSCHIFIALDESLGGANHETVLGNIEEEDGGMIAIENIVRNREESGHGELLDMQGDLLMMGNDALSEYTGVDRIVACGRL
jgi:cyclophilin family peptidyl-prolyl cis-trans isomerase